MKNIITYLLFLFALTSLTLLFEMAIGYRYHIPTGFVYMHMKTYILTDSLACLSLFFLIPSGRSLSRIILVISICFALIVIGGAVMNRINLFYSNIPEVVILSQLYGLKLTLAKVAAAFIVSVTTAFIYIKKLRNTKSH